MRSKVKVDSKKRAKSDIQAKLILLTSLFELLEYENLNCKNPRKIKLNTQLLKKFFLFNNILLTLTKFFLK